jgi:hypothetical protein
LGSDNLKTVDMELLKSIGSQLFIPRVNKLYFKNGMAAKNFQKLVL